MSHTSIATIDELGRILLPATVRKRVGWRAGTKLEVYTNLGNTITLKLFEVSQEDICNVCDSEETVAIVKGFKICANCLQEFNDGAEGQ